MAFNDLMNKSKEKLSDMNEVRKKRASETHIVINTLGKGATELSKQVDGYFYINRNDSTLFTVIDCNWNGPQFNTITRSETKGVSEGKTKKKGRLTGAVVGSLILPGAGTLIGAMAGTGGKKHKGTNQSSTITYDEQIELDVPGCVKLRNIETSEVISLQFSCKSDVYSKIASVCPVDTISNQSSNDEYQDIEVVELSSDDPYMEIKKAKELLDMGIISQEEFDAKKKQLLGL